MIEKIINDHKKDAQNLNEIKSFFKTYELHKILLSIRPDNYIPEHLYSFHVDNLERKIQFGYQKILAFIIHQDWMSVPGKGMQISQIGPSQPISQAQ